MKQLILTFVAAFAIQANELPPPIPPPVEILSDDAIGADTTPCALDRGTNTYLSEGATNTALHPPSTGTLRVAVIFVDFPDAPFSESAETLYNSFVAAGAAWFQSASNGRFTLDLRPTFTWFRMPQTSASYGFDALTFQRHRTYIRDAVTAANAAVDFSQTETVFVISSRDAAIPVSPTFLGNTSDAIEADGSGIRLGVTFGRDVRNATPNYGANVLVHETLHILGLPDLYLFSLPFPDYLGPVGGWDPMSWVRPGAHLFAWHLRKLGWIDTSQAVCSGGGVIEATLTPPTTQGGTKAIVARTSASTALVVELRTQSGLDALLCDQGVLIYTVDAKGATGAGPVQVIAANNSTALNNTCGPKYAAPFDIGAGEVAAYTDTASGIRVEVLSRTSTTANVRVTYPNLRLRAIRR